MSLYERINNLERELLLHTQALKELEQVLIRLKNDKDVSQSIISEKELKLKDLENELIICQTERDDIREQIGFKIEELKQSDLSKEERAERIYELMANEYQQLKIACQKITQS